MDAEIWKWRESHRNGGKNETFQIAECSDLIGDVCFKVYEYEVSYEGQV